MYKRKLSGKGWAICLIMIAVVITVWAWGCLIFLNQDVMLSVAVAAICFVMMLTGAEALIGQASQNSLETLTKKEIRRGFGLLQIGGFISLISVLLEIVLKHSKKMPLQMLIGATLVSVFSTICIGSFKQEENR
ncbi:MAG: hypothetical protein IJI05_03270 [Erysipelotrichaceae bacterium]|nr:hypothetical protein [Erysipelotrichaceae bacterium]